jgi:hypothetical protein
MARGYVNQTLSNYTGGVRWDAEQTAIKGTRWVSMLLPIWLYAYTEATPTGQMMHYIAVNGRTGETQGSVPLNVEKADSSARGLGCGVSAIAIPLLVVAAISAVVGVLGKPTAFVFTFGALLVAVLPLQIARIVSQERREKIADRQRNPEARLMPEFETKYTPTGFARSDQYLNQFTHRGGNVIDARNDDTPNVRAAYSRVFLADAPPPPPASVSAPVSAAPTNGQDAPSDAMDHPVAGQVVSPGGT